MLVNVYAFAIRGSMSGTFVDTSIIKMYSKENGIKITQLYEIIERIRREVNEQNATQD